MSNRPGASWAERGVSGNSTGGCRETGQATSRPATVAALPMVEKMDLRKIKKLIELLEESGISELEVRKGDESVRIVRPPVPVPGEPESRRAVPAIAAQTSSSVTARAPMAGTFYAGPEPGAARFVSPGTVVGVGDILCIIESMKMMNEIPSEVEGVIVDALVTDGEPVAKGQGLFRIG